MTKLEARYTEIMLQILKFTIILDELEIKAIFIIKSSLTLHEANPVYACILSIIGNTQNRTNNHEDIALGIVDIATSISNTFNLEML